jgi:hypothetical protein
VIKTQQKTDKKFAMKLPILSPAITIPATLLLIFVFLGATSYLYLQSTSADTYRQDSSIAYRQALEESFRLEDAQQEWKRLYKYHGNPTAVIYEERKTPFFYDKQGNKCAFIRQGELNH